MSKKISATLAITIIISAVILIGAIFIYLYKFPQGEPQIITVPEPPVTSIAPTEFKPSEVSCDINPMTGKRNECYCKYDETRNKIAIIIKENGIYDNNQALTITFNQYFVAVKNHLNIDNAGIKKFSEATKEKLDEFTEELVKNEYVGYIILVGMDLPITVSTPLIPPSPGAAGEQKVGLDLDSENNIYSYVGREPTGCKDVAVSFVVAPKFYNDNQKVDFVNDVFLNFANYHGKKNGVYNSFNGKTLVIREPEFFGENVYKDSDSYLTGFFYNPVFLSNWDHNQVTSKMKNHNLMLSYYVHGSPIELGLGLKEGSGPTYVTNDEILEFYSTNGQPALFIDVLAACNNDVLDYNLYSYDYNESPNIQKRRANSGFCCWPQTWLKTGAWAISEVYSSGHYNFERWTYNEKIIGKALKKTYHVQGMIYGDILATFP